MLGREIVRVSLTLTCVRFPPPTTTHTYTAIVPLSRTAHAASSPQKFYHGDGESFKPFHFIEAVKDA